jgi:hypothetical protein
VKSWCSSVYKTNLNLYFNHVWFRQVIVTDSDKLSIYDNLSESDVIKIQIEICFVNRWTLSINFVFCCKGRGQTYYKDLSGEQTWIGNNLNWFVGRCEFDENVEKKKYIYTNVYIFFSESDVNKILFQNRIE